VSVPVFAALNFAVDLDAQGRVYWGDIPPEGRQFLGPGDRAGRHADSTWIYRLKPPGRAFDTVASIVHRSAAWIGSVYRLPVRFGAHDEWGALPDGSLWIARAGQNRVDRKAPDGPWRLGAPLAWRPVRTTRADERRIPDLSTPERGDSTFHPMARVKPPFDYAIADDAGEVWTHVVQPNGYTQELFAVFPAFGASTSRMALPKGRRIVRLSAAWVYALVEDADGGWTLERYSRPAIR